MKWTDKIEDWKNGVLLKYPKRIKKSFFWETKPIYKKNDKKNNILGMYKEKFIQSNKLEKLRQNYKPFSKQIKEADNKYCLSFYNLDKTSLLIIPYPRKNKNFSTLKKFIDNSSKLQQKKFWMLVSESISIMLKKHNKIWVSTHGLGVSYLHVRIDTKPKYYKTTEFTK